MAYENSMYCKLFTSLYQGTLRGRSHEILVFTNLLAHADQFGIVDKHFRSIAEEVGLNIDEVKQAILHLEEPDEESRSPEEEGRRIIKMDEHRVWGWRIVNYGKYRAIRNEDDRREQNRAAQEKWRNKNKPPSADVIQPKPQSAHTEADSEAKADTKASPYSEGFEQFWSAYPRRIAKKEAWGAWSKAKGKPDLQTILTALERQKRSDQWTKDAGQFIPHPATWINKGRWDDEILLAASKPARRKIADDFGRES